MYSEKLLIALLSLLDVFDGGNLAKDQFINLCSNNAVRITIYSNMLCCRRLRGIRCTSVLSFSPVSKLLDDTYLNKESGRSLAVHALEESERNSYCSSWQWHFQAAPVDLTNPISWGSHYSQLSRLEWQEWCSTHMHKREDEMGKYSVRIGLREHCPIASWLFVCS